ncbi:MAG TPA: ABC transporter permease [Rhodanobacteraceae bacterium]
MFGYYLQLGLRSLKRNRALTALMVMTIAFGVAASMTTWSVFRSVSGDPIPWKSSSLFVPQIDNWGPSRNQTNGGEPPQALAYMDAVNLMRAHRARYQSAMYPVSPLIVPARTGGHPFSEAGHAVFSEFFPMVDAPFKYGSAWSAADDAKRARVVVIGSRLNDKLFGGGDSVGKTIHIGGTDYRVTGVLKPWNPQPRFYDVVNGSYHVHGEALFVPFNTAIDVGMRRNGNMNCYTPPTEPGMQGEEQSECSWVAFMVELDSSSQVAAYKRFLDGYARQQQQAGRFTWSPNNRLRDLPQWLTYMHVVPPNTRIALLVALGLLLVCLVNTTGLLLAKFMRRSGEIGVRRALGAPRREIYMQYLIEAAMVGVAGGVLGLALTSLGVVGVGLVMPANIASLAHINVSLLALTVLVSIVATALAGLYPTFRAAHVNPAWQLRSN